MLPVLCSAQDTLKPTSNLIVKGIPPIPFSIAEDLQRYLEFRSASFSAWHPIKNEMMVSTRFGNVPQLHQVKTPLGMRRQLTFFNEPISNAVYQPVTASYFLFTKDIGGNEFAQIYRYDMNNGKTTLLTDGKRSQNGGIRFSNDGKWIVYASTKRNGADRDFYRMDPMAPSSDKLLVQNDGGGWAIADVSPDNKQLLVTQYISANQSHYWLVDVATGVKRPLTPQDEKQVAYGEAKFSRDGKGIYFVTDKNNEFARLTYMDLSTKKSRILSTGINWGVVNIELSKDGRQLAFLTNEAGESKLYILNTADDKYRQLSKLPLGVYGALSFHNNSRDLAITINNAKSPTDIFVLNLVSNNITQWTSSEMGGLNANELNYPELVKWKSFDGKEISGFYYKPNKSFTGKRPVLISIHGGPEGQSTPVFQGANNYYLNELGVAIIYPNVRGSSGYGKTFLAADNGYKREESVKDIGALLDWIALQPELDKDRIMVTGGSYGGYMTLAVATHYNDRIRCALDVVGISHFGTFLKNTESYRRDLRRVEYGDERDADMNKFFEAIAPLNNAHKITKPLFIVQGGNDPRVPRTEAVQMADKVAANGGVVWYLEAMDEGHGFRKKGNADFQRYATVLFMQQYLLN